jgi:FlaA1/EpsC-like NDP-sugar epimerase
VFEHAGFTVLRSGVSYTNQFIFVEARVAANQPEREAFDILPIRRSVLEFDAMFRKAIDEWSYFLRAAQAKRKRVAFWGAGAKGVTFLNVVPEARCIEPVIDLNKRKQDMYVPGTGQRIASPSALQSNAPDYVISLNPVYEPEITAMLHAMGVASRVVTDARQMKALAAGY